MLRCPTGVYDFARCFEGFGQAESTIWLKLQRDEIAELEICMHVNLLEMWERANYSCHFKVLKVFNISNIPNDDVNTNW